MLVRGAMVLLMVRKVRLGRFAEQCRASLRIGIRINRQADSLGFEAAPELRRCRCKQGNQPYASVMQNLGLDPCERMAALDAKRQTKVAAFRQGRFEPGGVSGQTDADETLLAPRCQGVQQKCDWNPDGYRNLQFTRKGQAAFYQAFRRRGGKAQVGLEDTKSETLVTKRAMGLPGQEPSPGAILQGNQPSKWRQRKAGCAEVRGGIFVHKPLACCQREYRKHRAGDAMPCRLLL